MVWEGQRSVEFATKDIAARSAARCCSLLLAIEVETSVSQRFRALVTRCDARHDASRLFLFLYQARLRACASRSDASLHLTRRFEAEKSAERVNSFPQWSADYFAG